MITIVYYVELDNTTGTHFAEGIYTRCVSKTWCQTFCDNFINCSPILKILSLLETAINLSIYKAIGNCAIYSTVADRIVVRLHVNRVGHEHKNS